MSAVQVSAMALLAIVLSFKAHDSLVASSLSYLVIGALLAWVLKPASTVYSKPNINEANLRTADSSRVDWKKHIETSAPKTGKKYCIVGGGFVGKKICHALLLRGETHVRIFDMDPNAADPFKGDARVTFVKGDVTNYDQVKAAIDGCDHVYSTFAIIRFQDRLEDQAALSYNVNVNGTQNVIKACQEAGVQVLVQTSTSNVCVSVKNMTLAMDENVPYVTRESAPNHYAWTKAISEQLVLKANSYALRTAAVRPCSAIFGAQDRHLLDNMLKMGRTMLPPNGGAGVIDFISVNNVVWGHLLCERALLDNPQEVGGQAYCVSNENPMRLFDFMSLVDRLRPNGLAMIPSPDLLLRGLAYLIEFNNKHGGIKVSGQLSALTGCTMEYLDFNYSFSSAKARRELGYSPLYTVEQGVDLAVKEYLAGGEMLPKLDKVRAV